MSSESAVRRIRLRAAAIWPTCGLSMCTADWKGLFEPMSASTELAAAMSATLASKRPCSMAKQPSAPMHCVPLISARPSLAPSSIGWSSAASRASAPERTMPRYSALPSPMSTSARWLKGDRSPEAPTEPCEGITGCTPWLSMSTISWTTSGRMPEKPLTSALTRRSIMARETADESGLPTPAAWLMTRFRCSSATSPGEMRRSFMKPKPVVMP